MMGRIVNGPTAAQLRASLKRALDCGDHEDQGALLLAHQREVMHAITAGVRARRGVDRRCAVELATAAEPARVAA